MICDNRQHQLEILDAANELIATITPDQRLAYVNLAGRRLLSIPAELDLSEELLYVRDFHSDETYDWLQQYALAEVVAGKGSWEGEVEFRNLSGQVFPVELLIIAHQDAQGQVNWLTGIGRDLRRRKRFESRQRLAWMVFDHTVEGIIITDAKARIQEVNQAFTEITGYSASEVIGLTPKFLRSNHHSAEFYQEIWDSIARQDHWQGEVWNRRKDGSVYLQWLSLNCVRNAQGEIDNYISVFHDLTELRAKEAEIAHLASHDPLTGLGNRLLLNDRMSHALNQARHQQSSLALLVMDLGNIQLINESLGYELCDELIRHQGKQLQQVIDEQHSLVRIGADEFALLFEDVTSMRDVIRLGERLLTLLGQPVDLRGQSLVLTPSMGIACFPADAEDSEALLIHAQSALASAKQAGRGSLRFFDQAVGYVAKERLALEQALRTAVKDGGLSLHFQPKVILPSAQVCGAEALLRWEHPEMGHLSPAVFIPLAETSGLIVELGGWVVHQVCECLGRWLNQGLNPVPVAVNIAIQQLEQPDFADWLVKQVNQAGIPVDLLELEVTETSLMKSENLALSTLEELRRHGFRIALDDFGTGYSSLSYLRKLPLATLKIDRSFVQEMQNDRVSDSIVHTVIQLAQNLSLEVVAEGIEALSQAERLQALGCSQAQGFYFYRPMPERDFHHLLESRSML